MNILTFLIHLNHSAFSSTHLSPFVLPLAGIKDLQSSDKWWATGKKLCGQKKMLHVHFVDTCTSVLGGKILHRSPPTCTLSLCRSYFRIVFSGANSNCRCVLATYNPFLIKFDQIWCVTRNGTCRLTLFRRSQLTFCQLGSKRTTRCLAMRKGPLRYVRTRHLGDRRRDQSR